MEKYERAVAEFRRPRTSTTTDRHRHADATPHTREPNSGRHRRAERGRTAPRRTRVQAGAQPVVVRVLELRDLVLDHLDPGRVLHHVRRRAGTTAARPRSRGAGRSSRASSWSSGCACPNWCRRSRPRAASTGGLETRRAQGRLLHRLAQPDRAARDRRVGRLRLRDVLRPTLDTYSTSWANGYSLKRVFLIFLVVLVLAALVNIFSSHLLAVLNNISVWWHVARRRGRRAHPDLRARATTRACRRVFTDTVNNTGFFGGKTSGAGFFFCVLPLSADPDPVHDHRLRRVGPPVGGDQERGQLGRQGHLALDLLLRDRRLDPAAVVPVRGAGRGRRRPRAAAASRSSSARR